MPLAMIAVIIQNISFGLFYFTFNSLNSKTLKTNNLVISCLPIWCFNIWNSTNSNSVNQVEQSYFAFTKKLKSTQNEWKYFYISTRDCFLWSNHFVTWYTVDRDSLSVILQSFCIKFNCIIWVSFYKIFCKV